MHFFQEATKLNFTEISSSNDWDSCTDNTPEKSCDVYKKSRSLDRNTEGNFEGYQAKDSIDASLSLEEAKSELDLEVSRCSKTLEQLYAIH